VPLSQLIDLVNERFGTDFNQADQLFFDQIVQAAVTDDGLRQAAAVNPEDKFELVLRNLLERLFVERMDQNEEIFVRFMNDAPFRKVVTTWMAEEAYRRLRLDQVSAGASPDHSPHAGFFACPVLTGTARTRRRSVRSGSVCVNSLCNALGFDLP
jgi:hypothetical protein